MVIPQASDSRWNSILQSRDTPNLQFLAAKLMLTKLRLAYSRDSSPANAKKLTSELKGVFEKHAQLPQVAADIKTLFGG